MQIVVNNILLDYTDSGGSGIPLVCLHGWMSDKRSFHELAMALPKNTRVITVDLPNFGKSQVSGNVTTLADYAAVVAAWLDKLQIVEYYLAGHSMGGQIALYATGMQVLHPEKLVLIAAAGVRDEAVNRKRLLRMASKLVGPLLPSLIKKKFYQVIGSDYNPSLSSVHKAVIEHVLAADIQVYARDITVPTLLVYGSDDASTPVRHAEKLASIIASSHIVVIAGHGHDVHQAAVSQVAQTIQDFLDA